MIQFLRSALALLATATLGAHAADVGKPMPAVPAAANFESGKPAVDIGSYRGKVLYVDFWASWCVPCRTSMPALEALYKKFGDRGFVVVGVNKDDRITDAQRFLQRYPATFPQATDADEKVVRAFAVPAMPSGYLIDRRGTVRRIHTGFTQETATALEREIDGLLKEGA
jgi:thiol-disulfide isomerase/thioredoxin